MQTGDTIAAIASAVGPAARMILRLSGPKSHQIAAHFTISSGQTLLARRLRFRDLEVPALFYTFHAPHSYTGEDTVEFHIPGNPLLARMLLEELIRQGARQAEAGEFTARAYFNGRIDLAQAEGVAATIAASSQSELRAARQLLAGELAQRLKPAMESIADTLALIEVGIDFSEEDVSFLSTDQIHNRLDAVLQMLQTLSGQTPRFEPLQHIPRIVLIGRANAGKSTLLNTLAGNDRAVVSPQAGTTRDVLSAEVLLGRGTIHLIDVAGIEQAVDPANVIDAQMQQHALTMLEQADYVVVVQDASDELEQLQTSRAPDVIVHTKSDLPHRPQHGLLVSAHTGRNIDALRERLDALAFGSATNSSLALNNRHLHAIADARQSLERARQQSDQAGAELLAVELREALDSLGTILGLVTPDDVLGRVFSAFCIGK